MMPKIDLWIINRLLRHLEGLKGLRAPIAFNVNLSNMTLADPESLGLIEAAVKASDVPAHQLIFRDYRDQRADQPACRAPLHSALKKLGCRFALDDFGTGFPRHPLAPPAGRLRQDRRQFRRGAWPAASSTTRW
jgi:EAL domain-containing protein (putative c-di-GMP-specific phosphodiesterase class I)